MRSREFLLIQYNWCPYKKRMLVHRQVRRKDQVRTKEKVHKDQVRTKEKVHKDHVRTKGEGPQRPCED